MNNQERTTLQFASLVHIFNKGVDTNLTENQKIHLRKPNKLRIKMSTYPTARGIK
jgi:hypothetical protein